jgi:hypothetical protein
MRLHGDVSVKVIQCAVRLFATLPAALIHALDFLITAARSLVLLSARYGDERINLRSVRDPATNIIYAHQTQKARKKEFSYDRTMAPATVLRGSKAELHGRRNIAGRESDSWWRRINNSRERVKGGRGKRQRGIAPMYETLCQNIPDAAAD